MSKPMTREQVLEVIQSTPRTEPCTFTGADFSDANLGGVDLSGLDLSGANFQGANLEGVNFTYANLRHADLRYAEPWGANFSGAALTGSQVHGVPYILSVTGLPSGHAIHWPTPGGWQTRVGCWAGTLADLQVLIDGEDWPEAGEEERERRRPSLQVFIAQARAHEALWPELVPMLAKRWG